MTDQAWEQCQLRTKQGGFGMDNLQEIQHAAQDFYTSGQLIFHSLPVNAMANGDKVWDFQPKAGTTVQETFTSWLMEARFIAQQGSNNYTTCLTSIRDDFAGKWLEALPKYEKFTF
ncbi:hypothetical protein B484DRAFT_411608 [Ochromonadaceae sp. CCMP2298]|nr:hypothetical protein B484DRAFT_411608 [Ochromonadaceae sp. CCMP2298]